MENIIATDVCFHQESWSLNNFNKKMYNVHKNLFFQKLKTLKILLKE